MHDDHVEVRGRRTGPVRTVLLWAAWALRWALVLGAISVVAPTTSGLAMRWGASWLFWAPFLAIVVVWPAFVFIRMVAWRLFQPCVREILPWDKVRSLWSDNHVIFVELNSPVGVLRGQIRPRGAGAATVRKLMAGIRGGYMPAETGNTRRRGRPVWLDRAVQLAALVAIGVGGWWFRAPLADWLVHVDEDPASLVPPRLSTAAWEAQRGAPCISRGQGAAKVVNKRDRDGLAWQVSGSADGLTLASVRWKAGSRRLELATSGAAVAGDKPRFFPGKDYVGLSMLVAEADWTGVEASLGRGSLDGLEGPLCSGRIQSLDVTKTSIGPLSGLTVDRDGDDLVVGAARPDPGVLLLPVRRRIHQGNPWFHTCEIPVHRERLVVEDVRKERRYASFFGGLEDEARVYALSRRDRGRLSGLAEGGATVPCAVVDSLVWTGLLHEPAMLGPDTGPIANRARDLAAAEPLVMMTDDARRALERLSRRHREVTAAISPSGDAESAEVIEGFLAAVNWEELLERVSFANHLPLLERTRQAMSGADPAGQAGEAFLVRLAEEFLARIPTTDAEWDSRIDVAETWLAVEPGTQWTVQELTIRVPDAQTAGYYKIIGRFIMADVAAAAETTLSQSTLPNLRARWAELRLSQHDIVLDVEKSTPRKAMEAWVTGNFEYLADRGLSKLMEQVQDQKAAIQAAAKATYRLEQPLGSAAQMAHYSPVRRDGSSSGWVGLFEQGSVVADFDLVDGKGAGSLPRRWLLATSGSYVTSAGKTSGLAVVDGRPVNFLLSGKQGGVVIVSDLGVVMGDLREGMTLPGDKRVLRPLRSLADFRVLLDWLRRHKASAFQTHLLVSEQGLAIDEAKASPDMRERRLLATGTRGGVPYIAVVDIPGSKRQSLFEAAVGAYAMLSTPESKGGPGLSVTGIANLDVGSFDILVARDRNGSNVYTGPLKLAGAHNLFSIRPR